MYKELNDRLKKVLNLRGSAVAMALSNDKPKLEKLNKTIRLCEMLNEMLSEGRSFYTSSYEHVCGGGAYHQGLEEIPVESKSGEFLHKRLKIFGSARQQEDSLVQIWG